MLFVSGDYETAIKATTRRIVPRLEITWTDPMIDSSIVAIANDVNYVNILDQVANLKTIPTHKWAHLSSDLKADGTFHPMPGSAIEARTNEMGWWGATACNGSGAWGTKPKITITFAARAIIYLYVSGDSIYEEYPEDFEIKIYTAGDVLVYTETVSGNVLINWSKDISSENITAAVKMTLEISKWSTPSRVVKILEFYSSLVETYEGDDIVSMHMIEEREIRDGTLPVGNIASKELDFEINNIKLSSGLVDPFFPSNTNSKLSTFMKKNRRVRAWLGLELPDDSIEYVSLGTYWTGDWSTPETGAGASTTARDRMELLRNAIYSSSEVIQNISLYDLLDGILTEAITAIPMSDLVWSIDDELHYYAVPYAYFERINYMEVIKKIVEACCGQAYISRDDVLIVTGPGIMSTTTTAGA